MLRRPLSVALALVLGAAALTAQTPAGNPAPAIPETPIGMQLREWLTAWNNADSVALERYYRKYQLERNMGTQMIRARTSGGFELVSIERSEPRRIEALWREKNTGNLAWMAAELMPEGQPGMKYSYLMGVPRGGSSADFRIGAAERARVIEGAIAKLEEHYVFPDIAGQMAALVREKNRRGEYDGLSIGPVLAQALTEDFRSVSRDKHLGVNFSPMRIPDRRPDAQPDSAERARMRAAMQEMNCGFQKTEVLPDNIGYLRFDFFGDPEACGPIATREMQKLADVDALIVDMRQNGGGSPPMVAHVTSYLFPDRVHLNDLWTRRTNETQEFWTRPDVPGRKLKNGIPVYVLTANRTFSGAEEFTYNLKNLKRATIVGETTGGGAHPVSGHRIDDHFSIGVPFARAINPYSKTNWEGTGVTPDVPVKAAEALDVALKMIREKKLTP